MNTVPGDAAAIKNNTLAVLEYPRAVAVLGATARAPGGPDRRRLEVVGTRAAAELSPHERFDGQPLTMEVFWREAAGDRPAGARAIEFPPRRDRYGEQLLEFARMIRDGVTAPSRHDRRHDVLIQEVLLAASGLDR